MSKPHCGLFLDMGLGKTVTTLSCLAHRLFEDFSVAKCLVIAPKNVAQSVWAQECSKWDHLKDIRCSTILGDLKHRRAALDADADLYIINRENVVWLMETLQAQKRKFPFDMVVIDELSSFKTMKSQRWKALHKIIQSVPYVVGLTGTPMSNGYLDLWAEVFLLDGGRRLFKHFGEYKERYFKAGARKGNIIYEWKLRLGAEAVINRSIKDICLSMTADDWLDLPPVIYNTIPVSLDSKARKTYDKFQKDKVIPLLQDSEETRQLDPMNPDDLDKMTSAIRGDTAAAISGKLLQMAGGAVYDDEKSVILIHDCKLDALAELLDTCQGEPVLCFYNYQHEKDRICERFPQAKVFSGAQDVADWNERKIPLLLCHPASAGHGLNLQHGGHITVWFGLNWSLELYQQANARLARPGQKESVIIHHLVCKGTVDEKVMEALQGKNLTQEALINALKQYLKETI